MSNTPQTKTPAIVNVSPVSNVLSLTGLGGGDTEITNATRVLNITSISTPGGGSVRPTTGYMYPRGTG